MRSGFKLIERVSLRAHVRVHIGAVSTTQSNQGSDCQQGQCALAGLPKQHRYAHVLDVHVYVYTTVADAI